MDLDQYINKTASLGKALKLGAKRFGSKTPPMKGVLATTGAYMGPTVVGRPDIGLAAAGATAAGSLAIGIGKETKAVVDLAKKMRKGSVKTAEVYKSAGLQRMLRVGKAAAKQSRPEMLLLQSKGKDSHIEAFIRAGQKNRRRNANMGPVAKSNAETHAYLGNQGMKRLREAGTI